jgi:hypothetical protein
MAEEKPSLHVDSDWKKQAAEEKKRLAEQEAQRRAQQQQQAAAAPAGVVGGAAAGAARQAAGPARQQREMPEASFGTLVQTLSTQALLYMGELAARGGEPMVNLDMARHHIDLLGILQDKTRGNLNPEEQALINNILYELRMRFIAIAQQYAQLP